MSAALMTGACGDDGGGGGGTGDGGGGNDNPNDGMKKTYVVSFLDVGKPDTSDPNIVPGFNLDNRDNRDMTMNPSAEGASADSCMQFDYTSPAPDNEAGVDNQLGVILASLSSLLNVTDAIKNTILDGTLLLVVTVEDIDNFSNDPSVKISLNAADIAGGGMPMASSNKLTGGQTVTLDTTLPTITSNGSIAGGRLQAGPLDVNLQNITLGMSTISFNIKQAEMRFDITETALGRGVVGGQLDVEDLIENVKMVAGDAIMPSIIEGTLRMQGDLNRQSNNTCSDISLGLVFEGVPVTVSN